MLLVGTHELSIDSKKRISVPFAIRRKLSDQTTGSGFYIAPGRRQGTLALYPDKQYEDMLGSMPGDEQLSDDAYAWRQFAFSQCALLQPDEQGRVLLPERLLRRAGIEKEAVLIAVGEHLELWSRDAYQSFEEQMWSSYPQQRARAIQEMRTLTSKPVAEVRASA